MLRIGLATLLLVDLALRTRHFTVFYTDSGALPFRVSPMPAVPLHVLSGAYWYQALLFVVAAVFALLMLVGLFTRLATIASWAILMSLHAQNAIIGYFADEILRAVLFWMMFVPSGLVWSLDASRRAEGDPSLRRRLIVSFGAAGLLIQVASVYFFSGLLKSGPDWWQSGSAIAIALQRDWLLRPFGAFLRDDLDWALQGVTFFVLAFEIVAPLLLFSPFATARLRLAIVSLSWFFQYGLGLSFFLGIMPWVNAVMMLAFVPPIFWDKLTKSATGERVRAWLEPRFPRRAPRAASESSPARGLLFGKLGQALAGVCLVYILSYNIAGVRESWTFSESLSRVGLFFRINQKWAMFSPIPPREDGWYVIPGELRNGKTVNLWWTGPELSWKKPEWIFDYHPSRRWSSYQMRLTEAIFDQLQWQHYRRRYAEWLCEDWNRRHSGDETLVRLEVIFVDERTREDLMPPTPVPRLFGKLECSRSEESDPTF